MQRLLTLCMCVRVRVWLVVSCTTTHRVHMMQAGGRQVDCEGSVQGV